MKKAFVFVLLTLLLDSCNRQKSSVCLNACNEPSSKQTDFQELNNFDNKQIAIEGYFNYEFENVSLAPKINSSFKNGLYVTIDDRFYDKVDNTFENHLKRLSNRKVLMVGKLDLHSHGHLGAYKGTLSNVCCITEL